MPARPDEAKQSGDGHSGDGHSPARNRVSLLKGSGYLTSIVSVALLAAVSWKSAAKEPVMLALLIAGAATSIIGMAFRWHSHRLEQREDGKS